MGATDSYTSHHVDQVIPMTSQSKQAYLEQAEKIEKALGELPAEHPLRAMLSESAALLTQAGDCTDSGGRHDNTRAAIIDRGYHWREIDANTRRGAKVQLIHRWSGVAIYGTISSHEKFFTHWAPLPTFEDKAVRR
jgi:hypothetical protein